MTLRAIDGGTNYYAQFTNGLPTDPNFFPIGVWLSSVESQANIDADKAMGLNTYVAITANSNLSLIQSNGMFLFAQQNELRNNTTAQSVAEGILLHDELDMFEGPGTGYQTMENTINGLPAAWDGRLMYNNYGKGVILWETDAEAARFINGTSTFGPYQNVVSSDIYWFTDPGLDGWLDAEFLYPGENRAGLTDAEKRLAANYGYVIDEMRKLDAMDGVRQPIWGFVEVGWPFSESAAEGGRTILPDELQAAVMHSLIAGARGIIYFNHSFGGPAGSFNVLRDPAYGNIRAAVDEINGLIEQLAPVLNSPFDDGYVTTGPSVRVMAKFYNNDHYVFAGSTQHASSTATFTLAGANPDMDGTATVINEGRTVTITDGVFQDFFADGEAWHIYDINLGTAPPPPPPPPPTAGSVAINDVTISEGNSGTKLATFTVTRSGGAAAFNVNFATANGTATTADSDYVARAATTLSFLANENTKTVTVTINGDTKVEPNETFSVVLSSPTNGATITDGTGVGTITNDDSVPPPPPPPGSNLVINGGFETGSFSGWALSGNTGGLYIAPTQFPGVPHSGTYSAGFGSFNSDGTIRQNITTTAGQHYTFSFWIKVDNGSSTPLNHFDAQWNGQTLLNLVNTPNSSYQFYSFDVIGNGGISVLEFDGWNNPDAWRLDDVSLTAVGAPPPPPPPPPINGTNGHDDLRGTAGNDIINGLGGQDHINGAAGNDLIHGNEGKDFVDGGPGVDTLWGDSGADEFVFKAGEGNGDTVMDFVGNGARTGDIFLFQGYGDKQDGATFTRVDATHYQIHSAIDGHNEIITLGSATVHDRDYVFI